MQLLPTVEAAALSTRSAGVGLAGIGTDSGRTFFSLAGPSLGAGPPSQQWESRGGFAVIWIAAALLATLSRNGRGRFEAAVCLSLFIFSIGGAVALQSLPVFDALRVPSRMLLVAAFPVAFLAGITTDDLSTRAPGFRVIRRRGELFAMALGFVDATTGATAFLGKAIRETRPCRPPTWSSHSLRHRIGAAT